MTSDTVAKLFSLIELNYLQLILLNNLATTSFNFLYLTKQQFSKEKNNYVLNTAVMAGSGFF